MSKTEGEHWCCENRDCGWSVVMTLSEEGDTKPICVSGAPMKRARIPVVFSYLDFLRGEEALGYEIEAETE